ncbi:NUDIX hydrolase [Candidatus Bathyarchaeota archaeon]|jgi:ADP-ribose pyrophosphatase|nr:NUDIX hydrolase [Candidatus Bathyarchaeota archaeon]
MWKVISSKLHYASPFLRVFEDKIILPNGEQTIFSRLDMPDFVTVLPITSTKILMVRNYRYPANQWFLELPSGIMEKGENPEQCAKRELREETGYHAKLSYVTWYHPISRSLQKAHIFLATSLINGSPDRDRTENQQVVTIPAQQILNKMDQGKLRHAPTVVALSLCRNFLLSQTE